MLRMPFSILRLKGILFKHTRDFKNDGEFLVVLEKQWNIKMRRIWHSQQEYVPQNPIWQLTVKYVNAFLTTYLTYSQPWTDIKCIRIVGHMVSWFKVDIGWSMVGRKWKCYVGTRLSYVYNRKWKPVLYIDVWQRQTKLASYTKEPIDWVRR
jgi:hypothetical protein